MGAPEVEPHLVAFRDHVLGVTETPVPAVPRPPYQEDRWIDRIAQWRDDPRVMAGGLAVIALVAGVFFYRSALGNGGSVEAGSVSAGPTETAPPTSMAAEVVVHVSGAVASPGVYRLPAGTRVTDAITAAGGPVEGAEADRLNLAALVGDGQRVYVPRAGEPIPQDAAASGTAAAGGVSGPLNLNLATIEQLEALPGVGPSLAGAIVAERDRRGGFRSVEDLLAVRGIGEKRLADLKSLVVV